VTLASSRKSLRELELDMDDAERSRLAESSLHTQKWQEFGELADSMKGLSRLVIVCIIYTHHLYYV